MVDIKFIHGDCLEIMPTLADKSVDLVVADPPYNIGKVREWDKWKRKVDYIEWLGSVFLECQRVLKENGSFYFFHNDPEQIAELVIWIRKNTRFVFKQFIVWNKLFDKAKNKGFLQGFIETDGLRNYQKMAEYCLFYTFQDKTGLTQVYDSVDCFTEIKHYLRGERKKVADANGTNLTGADEILAKATDTSTIVRHYWGDAQWILPTKEMYEKMQTTGFFCREYEDLRREYEDLRREYEDLRYTFNNQKTHHSVWNYEIAGKHGHATPKPVPLIENIIKHSSNEGDTVLDPFAGSGTTGVACLNTGRKFILIEKDAGYCEIIRKRIESHQPLLQAVNQ